MSAGGPIVVGVSPTTGSPDALRWAADEAHLRGTKLRAVLAWRPLRAPLAAGGRPPVGLTQAATDPAGDAEQMLRGFVVAALGSDDGVDCTAVKGSAVHALLAAADDAQMIVVGEPRPGRVAAVRASLVAPVLVAQANCPVVAMPGAVGATRS